MRLVRLGPACTRSTLYSLVSVEFLRINSFTTSTLGTYIIIVQLRQHALSWQAPLTIVQGIRHQ